MRVTAAFSAAARAGFQDGLILIFCLAASRGWRSRGAIATTPQDVFEALLSEDYRYGANPDRERARWQAALKRFEDNATLGDALAMAGLSIALSRGLGTEKNEADAYRWALESF